MAGDSQAELFRLSAGRQGLHVTPFRCLADARFMPQSARCPPPALRGSLCSGPARTDLPRSRTDTTCLPPDAMSNAEAGLFLPLLSADKQSFGAILITRALTSSLDPAGSPKGARQPGLPHRGQASARHVCPDRLHSCPPGAAEATHVGGRHGDMAQGRGMELASRWGQLVVNRPPPFSLQRGLTQGTGNPVHL